MKTAAPVAGAAVWERSQAEKASVFDADIRWFESNRSCHRKRKGERYVPKKRIETMV